MIRILHTSDWHLGKRLDRFSRLAEQEACLQKICSLAAEEQVQLVLLAGDIFDTFNPPSEAEELLYKYLKILSDDGNRPVIAIGGNHDSAERISAPNPLARECGILFYGGPSDVISPFSLGNGFALLRSEPGFIEIRLPGNDTPVRIILAPYANETRLGKFFGTEDKERAVASHLQEWWHNLAAKYMDAGGINLMMAHLYFRLSPDDDIRETEDERSIDYVGGIQALHTDLVPSQVQYTALGHIHGFHRLGNPENPVIYCSSILPYSIDDKMQNKQVVIVDADKGKPVSYRQVPLDTGYPIFKKAFREVAEAREWLTAHPDCYVEVVVEVEEYLLPSEKRELSEAHPRLLQIIPVARKVAYEEEALPDTEKHYSREELFIEYYRHQYKAEPGEKIRGLFKEIIQS